MKPIPYEKRDIIPIPNWIVWLVAILSVSPIAYLIATVIFNLREFYQS